MLCSVTLAGCRCSTVGSRKCILVCFDRLENGSRLSDQISGFVLQACLSQLHLTHRVLMDKSCCIVWEWECNSSYWPGCQC